jgi:FkbM family methyltransferase
VTLDLAKWKNSYGLADGPTIHIGAHLVQERYDYKLNYMEPVFWVEGLPKIAEQADLLLADFSNQTLVQAVVSDFTGKSVRLNNSSNNGQSSSLLEPRIHSLIHPDVKFEPTGIYISTTIDDLLEKHFPVSAVALLVLDIQGAELLALRGGQATLKKVDFIFTEVSTAKLYKNQPLFDDLSKFLNKFGFCLIEHNLSKRTFHGDALYIKKELAISKGIKTQNTPRRSNLYLILLIYFRRLRKFWQIKKI